MALSIVAERTAVFQIKNQNAKSKNAVYRS
jgi:hypothetical protein